MAVGSSNRNSRYSPNEPICVNLYQYDDGGTLIDAGGPLPPRAEYVGDKC